MTGAATIKFNLQRIYLNRDGYDSSGSYWGVDKPLYWATDGAGTDMHFRAANREAAKRIIRNKLPNATFYR